MKSSEVIAGVPRVPHDAIEDFVRRAEALLDSRAESDADFSLFLDDAVVNLRQLLAEHAIIAREQKAALGSLHKLLKQIEKTGGWLSMEQQADLREARELLVEDDAAVST